jgi:hypothetical protein
MSATPTAAEIPDADPPKYRLVSLLYRLPGDYGELSRGALVRRRRSGGGRLGPVRAIMFAGWLNEATWARLG